MYYIFSRLNFHQQNILSIESETGFAINDDVRKMLNSTSSLAEADAQYMRHLLEFLYKEDLGVLNHRSLTGYTPKKSVDHKVISPEKKDFLFSMFTGRLQNPKIPLEDKVKRMDKAYIGRKIAVAIGTIRKAIAKKNAELLPSE